MTLGGNVQIEGNVYNSVSRNVYLGAGKYITIADGDTAPQEGMSVGVTLGTTGGLGQFTTNGTEDDVQYFFSDATDKNVEFITDHLELTQHAHDDITFIPWESDNSLPTEAGSYFLTKDVTLSGTWEVPSGATNLCLNGNVIKGNESSRVITVPNNATLNLYDCDNYTTPHEGCVDDNGLWHYDSDSGTTKIINGGIVTGGYGDNGGGVYVSGAFNMYGGNIAGCKGYFCGGGVYIYGNTSTIRGGVVQYCTASYGGGLSIKNDGKCVMSGGSIEHCRCNSMDWDHSGGVLVSDESTFDFEGGKIFGNTSKCVGAVVVERNSKFNMTGGTISGNIGGDISSCGLYCNESELNIFGGVITGNSGGQNGGGVGFETGKVNVITIGGTAQITGNVVGGTQDPTTGLYTGGTPSNVYLPSDNYIAIATGDKAPQEGMQVGVTLGSSTGLGKFTTNGTEDDVQYFFADDGGDTIVTCPGGCLALHVHGDWQYIGHYDTLFLECGNQHCTEPRLVTDTLTLTADHAEKVYDGYPYDGVSIDMTDDFLMDGYTLETLYAKVTVDEEGRPINYEPTTSTAPIDAGNYVVRVYAIAHSRDGEGDRRAMANNYAEAAFTILRADYIGYDTEAECTLGARPGSTVSFQLPNIPESTSYGTVANTNNFTVGDISTDGTVTLTTNAGGLPPTVPMTFTVTVNPDSNHNPYDITVTVTPQPSEITGVYYFYNAAAGKWLGVDNLHNGMKASLVDKPQPILVTDNGGYTYLLDAYIASSAGNGYLGLVSNECLMNCAEGAAVSFWPVNDNIYTVSDVNGHVFGYDGSGTLLSASATGENSHWTLLTRDDLISSLASATLASPKDATFLISDPQCGKDNRLFNEKWQGAGLEKAGSDGNAHASANTGGTGTFNAYQDLERGDELDIPNGIYELSVQGFYSSTSNKRCAYFYANNNTMALKNIASAEQQPTTEEEASAAFTDGKYQCNTIKIIVINHSIRIGVNGIYDECGWTAFDNFRLTYFGPIGQ